MHLRTRKNNWKEHIFLNKMKIINREEAIEKIIEHELKDLVEKFQNEDLSYFEDLLRNGGLLIGYEDMNDKDLEDEYYELFDEEVLIVKTPPSSERQDSKR